jgi:hypothetical protein
MVESIHHSNPHLQLNMTMRRPRYFIKFQDQLIGLLKILIQRVHAYVYRLSVCTSISNCMLVLKKINLFSHIHFTIKM